MARQKRPFTLSGIIWVVVIIVGYVFFRDLTSEPESVSVSGSEETEVIAIEPIEPERPFSGKGYVLEFSSDFNPGRNQIDDLGISIVIAVDISGSMSDPPASGRRTPKYIQASQALERIVELIDDLRTSEALEGLILNIGVIGFSNTVREIFPLSTMNPQNISKLLELFSDPGNLQPEGRTAIGRALEKGAEILAQSGTIFKSLIVVSDGENTTGPDPADVLWAINENRNSASTVDFPVLTRGTLVSFVGFDIDTGIFVPIEEEGARVTAAADQEELQEALKTLLIADVTRLEAAE